MKLTADNFSLAISASIGCLCLLLTGAVHAGEILADFSWHAPVQTETGAPYYRITLPVDAYLNAAKPGLADLRIFNAGGAPVPYARALQTDRSEHSSKITPLHWFPLRGTTGDNTDESALNVTVQQADNGTLVEVKSKSGSKIAGKNKAVRGYLLDASELNRRENAETLELDWSGATDGFQLLDIEASDNLQDWHTVQHDVQLARLNFNGERIERRRIELAGLPGRYLRLQWRDPAIAPVLTRAEITQSSAQWRSPPLAWSVPVEPLHSQLNLRPGEFHYRLPQALPISRMRIALPQGNVLLPLEILQPVHERRDWQSITHGVAYRISSNGHEWIQDEVILSGQMLKEFIVRFDPRSSQGISAPAIRIGITPEQVVFLAEGAPPYQLAVGNPKIGNGALPLSTLVPGLGDQGAPRISEATVAVGSISVVPKGNRAIATDLTTDWKKTALWGLLIAGVVAMGAMAWQLLRQMNQK